MSFTTSALLVAWLAIALLGLALAGVLARLHRLEELVGGSDRRPAGPASLAVPGVDEGPVLALFVDAGCGSCERAVDEMAELVDRGRAVVLWRHDQGEVFLDAGVTATPHAVVADQDLRIVRSLPVGGPEPLAEAIAEVEALATAAP